MILSSFYKSYIFLFLSLSFFLIASFSSPSNTSTTTTTSAWDSFLNLSGCHVGDNNPVLPLLKTYLRRFGYLPQPLNVEDDTFDADLEAAVKAYQKNFHLDPTGLLDLPTISQLISPRCGVADVINGTSSMSSSTSGRHLYTYFPSNPTWPPSERNLTYAFTSTSAVSIPASTLRPVFSRAFTRWSTTTELTFTEVSLDSGGDDAPDITIGFYRGDHGDGEAFDGRLGTLAHAFSPTDGRFHLDADESWVAEGEVGEDGVDLESVAVHEIGHLLGLGHSSSEEAIMYPTIRTGTRKVELTKDDVEGVQSLYGSNPSYKEGVGSMENERDSNGGGGGDGDGGVRLMMRACVLMLSILILLVL